MVVLAMWAWIDGSIGHTIENNGLPRGGWGRCRRPGSSSGHATRAISPRDILDISGTERERVGHQCPQCWLNQKPNGREKKHQLQGHWQGHAPMGPW